MRFLENEFFVPWASFDCNCLTLSETLNLDNSSKKNEIQKKILILNFTLDELFNDTTHISLR